MQDKGQEKMQQATPQTMVLTNSALLKYTIFSIVFAAFTLLIIILPAEYDIDPTGIGHELGLTVFHQGNDENADQLLTPEASKKSKGASETIEVLVPAGRGVEYKFIMAQYQKLEYEWITDGSALYFDLHGEPEGDKTGYFESYAIATLSEMKGSFTAPFAGSQGWYWKNTSNSPVIVQLIVKGEYSKHGLK